MSVQSSSTDLAASLNLASKYLFQSVGVILFVFGNLSCILNIAVFTRKNLRKNPCSIYFIAANIFNSLYINSTLLATIFESGFNLAVTTKYIVPCRLTYYTALFSNVLGSYCLVLAAIDRFLITSQNVSTRQRSTLRGSYLCVIGGTIFWMLFHTPALIFMTITQIAANLSVCSYHIGFYLTFIGYYSIIKESSSILLLLIFGLLTVKNMQHSRRAVLPSVTLQAGIRRQTVPYIIQSKDRQLVTMIFIDIISYTIFCSAAAMFYTEQQITQYQNKSTEQIAIETFIKRLSVIWIRIPYSMTCYTNLLVSKNYRNAIKNLFSRH